MRKVVIFAALFLFAAPAFALTDFDGDGIPDIRDNCRIVVNTDQRDTDQDGIGNLCDADLNNDGLTNSLDLGLFKTAFGSVIGDPKYNPNADLNGDGRINSLDLGLFKSLYRNAPGPGPVPLYTTDYESADLDVDWSTDNGVWEIGDPIDTAPTQCHSGARCAGTVLNGNYPEDTQSRLISRSIQLPALESGEELQLRFWHWFSFDNTDAGSVQISVETSPGVWGAWTSLASYTLSSGVWTRTIVELSAYAGKKVRLGFWLGQSRDGFGGGGVGPGWYVDDMAVEMAKPLPKALPYMDGFESGLGDWSADNGMWEVGAPTAGPAACHSGTQCAGTVLSGNYPEDTQSRLVSPSLQLTALAAQEELQLRFWHWSSFDNTDAGYVQISVETSPGVWGAWTTLTSYKLSSGVWTRASVDLSAYAGKKARLGFLLGQSRDGFGGGGVGPGWYVDDVAVEIAKPLPKALPYADGFESGLGGWSADNGVWEVGTPAAGPAACHSGTQCAGTVLNGNYPEDTQSRLVSPSLQLPALGADQELRLRFWHWFSFDNTDAGYVQVSVETSPGVWGAWTTLASYTLSSGVWTPAAPEGLSAYAGKKVRLGFLLGQSRDGFGGGGVGPGWYVDDVTVNVVSTLSLSGARKSKQ